MNENQIYTYQMQLWEENVRLERTVYYLQAAAALTTIALGLIILAKHIK